MLGEGETGSGGLVEVDGAVPADALAPGNRPVDLGVGCLFVVTAQSGGDGQWIVVGTVCVLSSSDKIPRSKESKIRTLSPCFMRKMEKKNSDKL